MVRIQIERIYKITNTINDKIYIGAHKTNNLNDNYTGSGKILKFAKEKYGIENFKKEYLAIFDNAEDMFNMEAQIVNEDFVKDDNTYNLKVGGIGGSEKGIKRSYEFKNNISKFQKNYQKRLLIENPEFVKFRQDRMYEGLKKYYENGGQNGFVGKSHSEETKKKMSKSQQGKQRGNKNSQFGSMWIHNLELKQSKKISKDEPIPSGWLKGRKIKF